MKSKMTHRLPFLIFALLIFSAGSSFATDRIVDGVGPDNPTCTLGSPCATIGAALTAAQQGDTIVLTAGVTFAEGELAITQNFLTIRSSFGSDVAVGAGGRAAAPTTPGVDACNVTEVCMDLDGFEYAFSIQANNVTIEGIEFLGDANDVGFEDTWAAIVVQGDYDRWTVRHNWMHNIGQMITGHPFNHSYGLYADVQTTSGTKYITGAEFEGNYVYDLGGVNVGGVDVTAGVAAHIEGLKGDVTKCDAINKFACGAWIHDNVMFDLARGINFDNFDEFVDGREPSIGIRIPKDAQNALPNSGSRVNANSYAGHTPSGDRLDIGVFIDNGGSRVEELNTAFATTRSYVHNAGRKATIAELNLAPFWKSLNPNPQSLLGPDSDAYYSNQTDAENSSADDATIVNLDGTLTAGVDEFDLTVYPGGATTSYKVSLDNNGLLNVREGARLLYVGTSFDPIGPGTLDGVDEIILNGTTGDDLLTIDFSNGNPIPFGLGTECTGGISSLSATCGIEFDGDDGFDKVILRGDEQVTNQAYYMGTLAPIPGVDPTATGTIVFEYASLIPAGHTAGTTSVVNFLNVEEDIEDVLITNGAFSVLAPQDTENEINLIDGPTVFGASTFQLNSGADQTFANINFRNKKNVHAYGSNLVFGAAGDARDVFTVFTPDGDAPALLQTVSLYGGQSFAITGDPTDDDYFVIRPSADFVINVDGDDDTSDDWFFLDCADVLGCDPGDGVGESLDGVLPTGTVSIAGFEDVNITTTELTAHDYEGTTDFAVVKTVNTFGDAHPGDVITFTVTVTNTVGATVDLTADELFVTDVTDQRFSLIEQSIVVTDGTVDVIGNRNMLWRLEDDASFVVGESKTMTYDVVINTLITTDAIPNWASILNDDDVLANNHDSTNVGLARVFGFPAKAEIQASVFAPTESGPRYIVGLYGGALDPGTLNIGPVMCRVPDQNKAAGWDGGLGNLWFSCGEGLPAKDGLFSPLIVTDLFRDQSGRIWLSSWGFGGLYYSDDDGKTWTDPFLDLTGGPGGAPDGIDDPVAQVYAISEDILGTLYISANNGDMYRSFDGGGTWQRAKQLPMGSADTPWSLEADPTIPGKLYAGTFGDSLYVTSNFGETWTKPDGNGLGNGHIFDIEFDPISGNLFVGTALGVYYSADEGDNWNGLNSSFPEPTVPPEVRHISFDENGVLYAGTWGQGVWVSTNWQATPLADFALKAGEITDLAISDGGVYVLTSGAEMIRFDALSYSSSVDTEDEVAELPTAYALEQNYPNPFNPVTSIAFSLPATQDVNLAVFDVLGRQVATLVSGPLAAGAHQVQFNAASLPSGMYLYRLTTPAGSVSKKMVLLK